MSGGSWLIRLWLATGPLVADARCAPGSASADDPARPAPTLSWQARGPGATPRVVELSGVDPVVLHLMKPPGMTPDRWRAFLRVRVVRGGAQPADDTPPVLGTYRVDGPVVRFEPRFPLEPGVRYRAEFDARGLAEVSRALAPSGDSAGRTPASVARLTADFSLPEPPARPTTIVTAVYPSRAVLPENLLRFYIHFSAPMSRGEAYPHVRLLDSSGKPVADPFLELGEELWTNDGKRFTLLFDPGRIKRGLKPREDLGPVLEAGRSYELVIDRGWIDAAGNPLEAGFRKAFRTGPADETSPDPKNWVVHPPGPMTRAPLEVRFPEPLDRALLDRQVAVRDDSDRPVVGAVSVADEETTWRFTPDTPWRPGSYRLVIGTDLEDVAGNSVARPFEVDIVGPITRRVVGATVERPFRIGPAAR